jgi:TfoX/Sxy family transcriptional regulator of competence genes
MPFPKADEKTKALFRSVVPDDPRVQVRPMFGHLAAFVDGTMFGGFFGSDIMVRLSDAERDRMTKEEGASPFAPMGRAMKDYILLPRSWRSDPERVRQVLRRAMEWAAGLPPKTAAARSKKGTANRSRAS